MAEITHRGESRRWALGLSSPATCHDGTTHGGSHRLATTLLDHRACPAPALIALYREQWEHEIATSRCGIPLLRG
jgi:hypothetical protein